MSNCGKLPTRLDRIAAAGVKLGDLEAWQVSAGGMDDKSVNNFPHRTHLQPLTWLPC